MRLLLLPALLGLAALATSCSAPAEDAPVNTNPDGSSTVSGVTVRMGFFAQKTATGEYVFPTYAAHLLGQTTKETLSDGTEVDRARHLVTIELENTSDAPRNVTLTYELSGFSSQGKKTFALAPKEKTVQYADATLDVAKLGAVTAPVQATYTYELEVDGKLLKANGIGLLVQPKENAFLTREGYTAQSTNELLVGAMTTPNHPAIQSLLNIPGTTFSGYQGITTEAQEVAVDRQLEAIYNAIKKRGVNYVSTTQSFFAGVQRVRWPSQSLDPAISSANCLDGALLFAAAAEAIKLDVKVIFVPGHAFVAVNKTPAKQRTTTRNNFAVIETTMVGTNTYAQALDAGDKNVTVKYKGQVKPVDLATVRAKGFMPGPY